MSLSSSSNRFSVAGVSRLLAGLLLLLLLASTPPSVSAARKKAVVADEYCGRENCYNVLRVDPSASDRQIKSAYRKLALTLHPDKNLDRPEEAADEFRAVSRAKDVLTNMRDEYDLYLKDPHSLLLRIKRFERMLRVPWQVVVAGTLLALGVLQWLGQTNKYETAVKHMKRFDKKLISRGNELANARFAEDGANKKLSKGDAKKKLAELKEEALDELARAARIGGGYRKPTVRGLLAVQIILLPWTLATYFWWLGRWVVLYNMMGKPYDDDAKAYLTRRALGMSSGQWEYLEEEERQEMIERELWVPENAEAWREQQQETELSKLSAATRKKYLRFMKKRKNA